MNIGLMDIDGHNFPNLSLMKISAWHKKQGDQVEFVNHFFDYDTVYKSKIFTFTPDDLTQVNANKIIKGGTAYNFNTLPDEIEHIYPDYSLYNYPHALGFLTRGCIRKCTFCIVPEKEGKIKNNADISEFWKGQRSAVLMDNNVLASQYGLKQIEKIIDLKISIDFNQGLDARIIAGNPEIAKLLARVKWFKPLRMACDYISMLPKVRKATELLRKYGATRKRYFVYVLVEDIQESLYIVNELNNMGLNPFAQPLITDKIIPTKQQKRFARWVNTKQLRNVTWENYKYNLI